MQHDKEVRNKEYIYPVIAGAELKRPQLQLAACSWTHVSAEPWELLVVSVTSLQYAWRTRGLTRLRFSEGSCTALVHVPLSMPRWVSHGCTSPPGPGTPRGAEDAPWGFSGALRAKEGCSPESCQCRAGWGERPTSPPRPAAWMGAFSFFPAGQPGRPWGGRVSEPREEEGGGGDRPLSPLLLPRLWRSCGCGSPELVAQQPESINMLCRKCRGSPSCCQREGRRLRVPRDPTPAWHPFGATPPSANPPLATVLYPLLLPYDDLARVPANPSGKVSPCSRTLLLRGFCF